MVIGRCHVCPSSACKSPEQSCCCNDTWQAGVRSSCEEVEQPNQDKARPRGDGNEDHKDRSFRVSVADGGRDGGKPLFRIAIVFVLYNFVVMERDTDYESSNKRSICDDCMSPRNVFSVELDGVSCSNGRCWEDQITHREHHVALLLGRHFRGTQAVKQ